MLQKVTERLEIPIIASGGVGTLQHLVEGLQAGAHAVLAASIFHFGDHTVGEARDLMRRNNIRMRPFDAALDSVDALIAEKAQ